MCVSVSPGVDVRFSDTVLYAAAVTAHNGTVHVLGYQNKAQNGVGRDHSWKSIFRSFRTRKPGNAMILPFPAVPGTMTRANVLDTEQCKEILQDMANALMPWRTPPVPASLGGGSSRVEIFEAAGIYTVVLAGDPRDIPQALEKVPASKRPLLNPALFEAYRQWYPEWTIALCCFNNEEVELAHPLLWWYQPMFPDELFLPALDCHTGEVPDLDAQVRVDHVLAVGSDKMTGGSRVHYRYDVPADVQPYLTRNVLGSSISETMRNGDFVCAVAAVDEGRFKPIRRRPPGAA